MFGATPPSDIHLYMDASDLGLAVLNPERNEFIVERFDAEEQAQMKSGEFSISVREHLCMALALWTWAPNWRPHAPNGVTHFRCWSDNAAAVAWNNTLSSSNTASQEINRAIGLGEAVFNVRISATHLPGASNTMADAASRSWAEPFSTIWSNFSVLWKQVPVPQIWRKPYKTFSTNCKPNLSSAKYSSTWKQWLQWCQLMPFQSWLPEDRALHSYQLALFAVFCWQNGFRTTGQGNSASMILSKICHNSWHHQCQLGFNVGLLPGHKLAITGMRRISEPNLRKQPITVAMLRTIHRSLNFSCSHDRVLWGATVMGFFYLLRRSEYLAQGKRIQHYAITRADVQVTDGNHQPCKSLASAKYAVVRFRGSKADQFGKGSTRTLARSGSPWCCPVQALWFLVEHHQSIGAHVNSPICKVGPRQILQVNDVATAIKHAAAANGENPDRFGSHSLRSGGATALFNAGVDSLAVKKLVVGDPTRSKLIPYSRRASPALWPSKCPPQFMNSSGHYRASQFATPCDRSGGAANQIRIHFPKRRWKGDLEIVQWLHENNCGGFTTMAMDSAAQHDHLDVVLYLLENRSEGFSHEALERTKDMKVLCAQGNLLQSMFKARPSFVRRCLSCLTETALRTSNIEILDRVNQFGLELRSTVPIPAAVCRGHVTLLQWFSRNGFEVSEPDLLKVAVQNGHLDTARWLSKRRYEINSLDLVEMAAIKRNIPLLRWLVEYGPPLDLQMARKLVMNDHYVEILWWVSEADRVQVVLDALKSDKRRVVWWILTRTRFEDEASRQIIRDGIHGASTNTLQWIHNNLVEAEDYSWCFTTHESTTVTTETRCCEKA